MSLMLYSLVINLWAISLSWGQYHEDYRPQIHYSPPKMWSNDPNGLVYYNGTYHLFYQYNPTQLNIGAMYWGHASSPDLFHWENLPIALSPQLMGQEYMFSGSAIVDLHNRTGFQPQGSPNKTMIAIFTGHKNPEGIQTQWLAYSGDDGITWKYYEKNPIIANPGLRDFRDPKVFSYGDYYVLVLAAGDHVNLYNSTDMKGWQLMQEFGFKAGSHAGTWECPDLFPINATIDGKTVEKWVLTTSTAGLVQYFIGTFNGHTFVNDNPDGLTLWVDYGPEDYAGVTYNMVDHPGNARRIYIAWVANWGYILDEPTVGWRGGMTIPRELSLIGTGAPDNKLRMASLPVPEIFTIWQNATQIRDRIIAANTSMPFPYKIGSKLVDMELELDVSGGDISTDRFGIEFKGEKDWLRVYYTGAGSKYVVDRSGAGRHDFSKNFGLTPEAPRLATGPVVSIRVVLDVSTVELFADKGLTVMTGSFFSTDRLTENVSVFYESMGTGSRLTVKSITVNELNSVWK